MDKLTSLFKALSDPNRLRIIAALMENSELCACQITELLHLSGATVSRHLSILTSAGLINSRKEGRWVYFSLKEKGSELQALYHWMKSEFKKSKTVKGDKVSLKKITSCAPEKVCRKQRRRKSVLSKVSQ